MNKLLVIGGGPAGMMGAYAAACEGASVTLLEGNEKLGKKLYITGKGRCNLTNAAEREEFLENVVRNRRFLFAAFHAFSNRDLMELFEGFGVPLKVERGGRVFPASDRSSDVTRALEHQLWKSGVDVRLNARVRSVEKRALGGFAVSLADGEVIETEKLLLATGGASYPSTGSTGDGWTFARALGHDVVTPYPALAPIETRESWPFALTGLSLKNVALRAYEGGKPLYDEQGELLLTHFGLSGPLALSLSSVLPQPCAGVRMSVDLKPALDLATLDKRLLRDFEEAPKKRLTSVLPGLAPKSLALCVSRLAGVDPETPICAVTQPQRRALAERLKDMPLTVKALRGFDEAIVTRGGVTVSQINPSTLESKRVEGLYFAGEMIDVDALTGGFNLQIAFSTGALAGRSAAR